MIYMGGLEAELTSKEADVMCPKEIVGTRHVMEKGTRVGCKWLVIGLQ